MKITEQNPVVMLIVRRDDIPIDEAIEQVQQVADDMYNAIINGSGDPEDIIQSELGLEPDYIFDILEI